MSKLELAEIVKLTFQYFYQEGYLFSEQKNQASNSPLPNFSLPKTSTEISPQKIEKIEDPIFPIKKTLPKKLQENKTSFSDWTLIATPLVERDVSIEEPFKHVFPFQKLYTPVLLILPDENDSHQLFLENVSRAITRMYASAKVEKFDHFNWDAHLVLAPLSLLRKRYPYIQLTHQLYQASDLTLLAMEDLERYLFDRDLKWALWNTIKNFPFPQNLSPVTHP